MPDTILILNKTFGIPSIAEIVEGEGALPKIQVRNEAAEAEIYLHGAHLTHFNRLGEPPLLWVSPEAVYREGKAIRGGVPLVWPWFGAHPTDSSKPQHGLARISEWEILDISADSKESTTVVLRLDHESVTSGLWEHPFSLEMAFTIGKTLMMSLRTTNEANEAVQIGCALHTYFAASHIGEVSISGLEDKQYLDQLDELTQKIQNGPITIDREVDRIYLDSGGTISLHDRQWNRTVTLQADPSSSNSTIVWNPWIEKAQRMGDFQDEGYKHMVCIETANAADDVRTLEPGASHALTVAVS